ncbi:MAG: hypothetical protein BWY73_00435 [candidate division TA06 bacterium ADurb.Bin417]|uniref:Uncharacterized protein n=1 Tax=candidate division TA06 bacterium ADurb.Bin417 TaxID=1852828 RepID=A0A1V5MIY9_UNCT6|nr:MAG: hypothetical protein BWY73_00435 [candidate division TA06 bacterium ADurb.Bin417]
MEAAFAHRLPPGGQPVPVNQDGDPAFFERIGEVILGVVEEAPEGVQRAFLEQAGIIVRFCLAQVIPAGFPAFALLLQRVQVKSLAAVVEEQVTGLEQVQGFAGLVLVVKIVKHVHVNPFLVLVGPDVDHHMAHGLLRPFDRPHDVDDAGRPGEGGRAHCEDPREMGAVPEVVPPGKPAEMVALEKGYPGPFPVPGGPVQVTEVDQGGELVPGAAVHLIEGKFAPVGAQERVAVVVGDKGKLADAVDLVVGLH